MKKNNSFLILILLMPLTACNNGTGSSSSITSLNSSSSKITNNISTTSNSINSSISISSTASSSNSGYNGTVIDSDAALNLAIGAELVDIGKAKTSEVTIDAVGYYDGRRYNQHQTISATSYLNDLTIAQGSVSQYFYDDEKTIYQDDFFQVKQLLDNNYINVKDYVSNIYEDEIERVNLLLSSPETINDALLSARAEVSCGLGSYAMADLYDTAIVNQSSLFFTSRYIDGTKLELIFYAEAENTKSNQKYIGQFTYLFDGVKTGYLLEYTSKQSYYPLNTYNNSTDKSTLEPTYYAIMEGKSNKGILSNYEGELPVDINSSFVSEIRLSANKTTIAVDEVVALKYQVLPETALNKELHFSSTNENIARVDSFGRVTGIKEGTCEIVATNIESGVEGKISITVTAKEKPDAGDDSTKTDLQIALSEALNRVFGFTKWIGGDYVESISGMCIDSEQALNSSAISELSISDFSYDENQRKAIYVGDYSKLLSIIPFYDNGNENLSNRYLLYNKYTMYCDEMLGMELYLSGDNTIHYLKFEMRTGYCDSDSVINVAELTDDNISEKLGEFTTGYKREVYYISQGRVEPNEK